jgi:glycosyltransferase involved in cell wall biosynthesis
MKSDKILVLFTNGFPFDSRESFLKNEIKYLYKSFNKVYIYSSYTGTTLLFDIPPHVKVSSIPVSFNAIQKLKSLRYLFYIKFFNELYFIKRKLNQPLSFQKIKIFLAEMQKAFIFYNKVKRHIGNELKKNNHIYFYSFWNDYKAIAVSLFKEKYPFVKAISRAHRWDVYFEGNIENYLPGKRLMCKTLDAIYYVSENGYRYSKEKLGDLPNLKVARLGILNSIAPDYNKQRIPFHIISCSSLIPLKRIDILIHALSLVSSIYPIKWTHIGDGPLAGLLKKLSVELLSVKTNITYHFTGYVENDEVINLFRKNNTNLFINVSDTEGVPVTIMEAMSCAIPVAGTKVGGVPEIVEDGINGVLLSADPYPQEIANVIENYIGMNEQLYLAQCKAAYTTWFEKFNAEKNYPEFINEVSKL